MSSLEDLHSAFDKAPWQFTMSTPLNVHRLIVPQHWNQASQPAGAVELDGLEPLSFALAGCILSERATGSTSLLLDHKSNRAQDEMRSLGRLRELEVD